MTRVILLPQRIPVTREQLYIRKLTPRGLRTAPPKRTKSAFGYGPTSERPKPSRRIYMLYDTDSNKLSCIRRIETPTHVAPSIGMQLNVQDGQVVA